MIRQISFIGLLLFFMVACKTAVKSFEKGDYEKSFNLALKECEKGNCSRQNRTIIEKSLAALLEEGKTKMDVYEYSYEVEDWEKAVSLAEDLRNKIEESVTYIDPLFLTQLDPLLERETQFRKRVVDRYLETGLDELAIAVRNEDVQYARNAYYDLKRAQEFSLEPLNIDSSLEEALLYGTININVTADMPFGISYDWDIDRIFANIKRESSLFTQISYEGVGQFDCIVNITFDSPNILYREESRVDDFNSRVVVRVETRRDSSGRTYEDPVYDNVRGRVVTNLETKTAELRADVRVRQNGNDCELSDESYYAALDSEVVRYILEGDQRAIPQEFKNVRPQRHENDDDMVEELIEEIYRRFAREYF